MVRFEINIPDRIISACIVVAVIFLLTGIAIAYTYTGTIPNPGHGGDTVWVNTSAGERTLQAAIDSGNLPTVRINSKTESLQQAITGGDLCHWEKSWKRYPVEGSDLSEKTSCDVGICQWKADSLGSCNPSNSTCSGTGYFDTCGRTTGGNDEWLFCCG